jgi:nucleoside-diphosphate-sugar epimerase
LAAANHRTANAPAGPLRRRPVLRLRRAQETGKRLRFRSGVKDGTFALRLSRSNVRLGDCMAILVTGATGFVGLAVSSHLAAAGEYVIKFADRPPPAQLVADMPAGRHRIVIGDVREVADIERACGTDAIDAVVHMAAITAGPQREASAPASIAAVNVGGTIAVLEAMAERKPRRIVHVSSASVYGDAEAGPSGTFVAGSTFPKPASLYGITKLAGEQTALRLGDVLCLDVRAVRLSAVFGPWEHETGVRDTMSPQWQVLVHAAAGRPAILPRPIRMDWLYVRDAAAGIAAVLGATGMQQRVVDLGGGASFDVLQWGSAVSKHRPGVVCRVAAGGEAPNVSYFLARDRTPLDNAAIERETGFRPQYDLQSSAADYASWLGRSESDGVLR